MRLCSTIGRDIAFVALIALGLSLSACYSSVGRWSYPSGRYRTTESARTANAFVLVEPFTDLRGDDNTSGMSWSYVPFFPFGWSHFDRPEATIHGEDTTRYEADPCDDLARSIAVELRRERIVERAEFARDFNRPGAETHVLHGTLRSFCVEETRWTYGVSVYAPILWCGFLPMGTSENGFCADLELVETSSGRVVWRETVFDYDHHLEGIYYGPEWYRFSRLWELRLREKLGGLATALGAEPPPLPPDVMRDLERSPPVRMPESLGVDSPAH